MQIAGYVVRETEAAVAFVFAEKVNVTIRPFWVPRSKITASQEQDTPSREIHTMQDGFRVGIPTILTIDDAFAAKIL